MADAPAGGRSAAIDAAKTLAIFGTLMIHASAAGGFNDVTGSLNWTTNLFWSCLLRCAVPVFLMCSGALFLPPEKDLLIKVLWKKYILRIFIALAVWSLAYVVWDDLILAYHWNGAVTGGDVQAALMDWVCFRHKYHLYYLVILLAVYAVLPITRLAAAKADAALLKYAMVLWAVAGCLLPFLFTAPPLALVEGFPREYAVSFTWSAVGLGMAGHLISRSEKKKAPRFYLLLYLLGFAVTFGGTFALSLGRGWLVESLLQGSVPGVVLQAVGIYGFCDSYFTQKQPPRWVETVSKASFCIYLIHPLFLDGMIAATFHAGVYFPLWIVPVQVVILFFAGLVSWLILRKIPIVNQYLI